MLYEVLVHILELAERGGVPCGYPGDRCPAARPVEQGRSAKVQRKATNLPLVVRQSVPCNYVVGDPKSALVVGLVQAHVHPSAVLLVQRLVGIAGALLQEGVGDLAVDVLLV